MKYVKYDENGRPTSTKQFKASKLDVQERNDAGLNVIVPLTRKRTIRGAIVGVILGVPVGGFAEIVHLFSSGRLAGSDEPADFSLGIIVFLVVILVSTAIGYISGSMADRD